MRKKTKKQKEGAQRAEGVPPASFSSHVLMLATGALQQLGVIANPLTKKEEKNLGLAKHTIDTLNILKNKTKGNLAEEEERLLDELLYDLRVKYVEVTRKK